MSLSEIRVQAAASSVASSPRVKSPPKKSKITHPFFYSPSDDGTDENLLIILHGLGDTHIPFSKMGKSLKLPQTAILVLRAPEQIPFLYEEAYQWYTSFDQLGELIERPNPTPAFEYLTKVLEHLTSSSECAWPLNRIHLFGFAQGGSVAAEFVVERWKKHLASKSVSKPDADSQFGTLVSISGPLLSYPTLSSQSPTPTLIAYRPPPSDSALPSSALVAYKKAFGSVVEHKMGGQAEGMPASKVEWEPIMRFWSQHVARRQVEGLYEVMTGANS